MHEVFPGDWLAPLMGWRAKPRLEMKLQASAPPPAIMALHALSTTPMQAPRKHDFHVHWVRLQHTISLSENKSHSPLDLKIFRQKSEIQWFQLNIFEQYGVVSRKNKNRPTAPCAHIYAPCLSFGYFSCGSCVLKRSVQKRPHATLESVRSTAVCQGKADVSEPEPSKIT